MRATAPPRNAPRRCWITREPLVRDINTYALFAELARKIVAPHGLVGLLVPSGIASDKTTRLFFSALVAEEALVRLYDFENRKGLFPDIHRSFKFCTLVFGGAERKTKKADFVF